MYIASSVFIFTIFVTKVEVTVTELGLVAVVNVIVRNL